MRILADQHIYYLEQLLPKQAELVYYDSSKPIPKLDGFDAWILRTVTKVNPTTVPVLPKELAFIGSASAGTDHIDKEYLSEAGITFDHSPGCNANAVAEYALTAMLRWCTLSQRKLTDYRVGIIGMGHTGGTLARKLDELGVPYAGYDPPKAERERTFRSCSLSALNTCDILSIHLPYINRSSNSTHHFIPDILSLNPHHKLIINAARGGIISEDYLLSYNSLKESSNKKISLVIDVWETEPIPNKTLANQALIATPHIAGYSKQAKLEASRGVLRRVLKFFNPKWTDQQWQPQPTDNKGNLSSKAIFKASKETYKPKRISMLHGLHNYDYEMRKLINKPTQSAEVNQLNTNIARGFQALRNTIELRNEFAHTAFPEAYPDSLRPLFAPD